ncbi:MAG: Flp pilus assembly complex ATPase component TadA [Oscillospiraceae bacterium]|nr:Flp pilus assembly complex ATPase component TadA [Oscillospiraceae bacterium]
MQISSAFRQVLPYFPLQLQTALRRIPEEQAVQIQEIRLRIGRNLHIVTQGTERVVTQEGAFASEPADGLRISRQLMDTVFQNLSSHSMHSVLGTVRLGFITVAGGSRAGICGTAVMQQTSLDSLRAVSGINLRIASERIGCADALIQRLGGIQYLGGILLAGPPSSGKTTLLRDIARILGERYRVSLLDERGELAAVSNGVPQYSVGIQTDVFDGYPKAQAISISLRVMSPQYIICDEIGSEAETEAMLQSLHTGTSFIASAHAGSADELYRRPQLRLLFQSGVFHTVVMLHSGAECGAVAAVVPVRQAG